jgi:glutathione S-transferase
MKFYDCKTAPSPRRVRIFAAEKGLQLETVEIDLRAGEQFAPEFREINADCTVPVLELDDGTHITEVLAICQYLEEIHPQPALIGETPERRANAMMWTLKVEQHGLLPCRDAFRNFAKGLKRHAMTGPVEYDQIPELAARGRKGVLIFLERLEQRLAESEYIAGDYFSIADIAALVLLDFAGWIKISIPDGAAHLQRWYDAASARPSAAL